MAHGRRIASALPPWSLRYRSVRYRSLCVRCVPMTSAPKQTASRARLRRARRDMVAAPSPILLVMAMIASPSFWK
jgi:hypothetical protein